MKALFISNDPKLFEEGSEVRSRMRSYATAIGELHILSRAPRGTQEIQEGALTLHPVSLSKLGIFTTLPSKAKELILGYSIEVVSAQDPFEYGFAARTAVNGTTAKLHIQVHTDFLSPWFSRSHESRLPFLSGIRRFLADQVLPQADGIRVVSSRIQQSLVRRYGNRIPAPSVIPITVRGEEAPTGSIPHEFAFTLITVARLAREKRVDDIVHALAQVKDERVGLIIVGEGSERPRLEALAREVGVGKRVIFTGWRTDSAVLLTSADAYIQASAYEGYGRTLIEAALAKLPIITTDVGIVGDVLHNEREVLVAPVGDTATLAGHIRTLLGSEEVRQRLGASAHTAAENHLAQCTDLPGMIRDDLSRALGAK